jgi:hypothetical protein
VGGAAHVAAVCAGVELDTSVVAPELGAWMAEFGRGALGCCGLPRGRSSAAACQRPRGRVHGTLGIRGPTRPAGQSVELSLTVQAVRGPLSRLAGARAKTLAALGYAAEESSPAPPAAPSLKIDARSDAESLAAIHHLDAKRGLVFLRAWVES